jgi:hypothetical protein
MALANPYARELKKRLVGRTIVKTEVRPFPDDRGGTTYNPRLTLDDGTTLVFDVDETDGDQYGIRILIHPETKP